MKLKYYLRGLGTGIAVTVLILGISRSFFYNGVMTDEEIVSRAKELGLVERTTLSEAISQPGESGEEILPEESEAEILPEESETETVPEKSETETVPEESETETVPEKSKTEIMPENSENEEEDVPFGMPAEAGTVTFQIVRGDSSISVSERLEENGLIDDASAYDHYLCQNGYDKKLRVGTYEIPVNATQDEIARMITGN